VRAVDLKVSLPVVRRETTAAEAGRLIADSGLVGLVIADRRGVPTAIVSAVDVLRLMLPGYLLDDVSLAAVFDEAAATELWDHISERTVGEMLDDEGVAVRKILSIESDATLVEIAARMVDARTQIALLQDSPPDAPMFVTLPAVISAVLATAGGTGTGAGDQ
jgi:CBS domain-containing protein